MTTVITLEDTPLIALMKMAEGNPGAISVLYDLMPKEHAVICLLHLDDMNIRGSKIWIGYKDFCNSDIDLFYTLIMDCDEKMQKFISDYSDNISSEIAHNLCNK